MVCSSPSRLSCPKDSLISSFIAVGSHAHSTAHNLFVWDLGMQLYPHDCVTNIFLSRVLPIILSFRRRISSLFFEVSGICSIVPSLVMKFFLDQFLDRVWKVRTLCLHYYELVFTVEEYILAQFLNSSS